MKDLSKFAILFVLATMAVGLAAADVEIDSVSVDPAEVEPGESVEQSFSLNMTGIVANGEEYNVFLGFPEGLSEDDLEIGSVDSNISVEEDGEFVDRNDDGEERTISTVLSEEGDGEEVTAEASFNVSVDYPEDFESMDVGVEVEGGSVSDNVTVSAVQGNDTQQEDDAAVNETANETSNETTNETDPGIINDSNESENMTEPETNESEFNESEDLGPINDTNEGPTETGPENETDNGAINDTTPNGEADGNQGIIESIVSFFQNLF